MYQGSFGALLYNQMKTKSILVGISGGVDSAAAALILKEKGYHVEGLYIYNGFTNKSEKEASDIAEKLGFPLHSIDLSESFKKDIADYFISEYIAARTPNPCIICNKKIKFRYLLGEAEKRGIDYIATGHYARIEYTGRENGFRLKKGIDRQKDQSYFLFQLGQEELSRTIFPIGDKTKKEVRKFADDFGFGRSTYKESQEICFIADDNYKKFIEDSLESDIFKPGDIVDTKGNIVGEHKGIHSVTIGQRKGLNIASERPWYVIKINRKTNEVIVGREEEQFFESLTAEDISWVSPEYSALSSLNAVTHIRYRHMGVDSEITIEPEGRTAYVKFKKLQKAVAPGQAAVFYQEDYLIGGGWIKEGVRCG